MESKKRKKKIHYTVMVVSDSSEGGIRQFFFSPRILLAAAAALLVILLGGGIYTAYVTSSLHSQTNANQVLSTKVENLTKEADELSFENEELSHKVTLLSETVNNKAQEAAEKSMPTGFPLSATASILQEEDLQPDAQEDGQPSVEEAQEAPQPADPIVVFSASAGTLVIATGNATVLSVEADPEYGNIVKLDHGNGYVSIYRCQPDPKVRVGDEITKGTMLYEMTAEGNRLGYQILENDAYIDPLELMEIYG